MYKKVEQLIRPNGLRVAERAIGDVQECLAVPTVVRALGVRGEALMELASTYLVACKPRAGVVDASLYGDNAIPVFAMKTGDTVQLPASAATPLQRELIKAYYMRVTMPEGMDRQTLLGWVDRFMVTNRKNGAPLEARMHSTAQAITVGRHVGWKLPREDAPLPMYARGRPHIGLRAADSRATAASCMLHELSHAHDYVAQSLVMGHLTRLSLASELAAYATQSVVAHEMRRAGKPNIWNTGSTALADRVEKVRHSINGPYTSEGAFDANDDVIAALANRDLTYIYETDAGD